jgi:hypothetical protein
MAAYDLANWYESSLAPAERKTRGHFSTPPPLVERILDACGFFPERNLTQLRVLDPACGSGNFLTAVLHRMLLSAKDSGLSQRQILGRVRQNLWGFDSDPVSCFMAEMHAYELLAAHGLSSSPCSPAPQLHIHQADALTFPWSQAIDEKRHAGVDLFLANPPYLATKNADLSAYRPIHKHQGQSDSYLLFLDLAIRAVRPGGWLGLVLPDPVLARANATPERQLLLRETTIYQLWHLSSVFSAFVGAVVIVAQKRLPKRSHQVAWTRGPWPGTRDPGELPSLNPSIKNGEAFVFSSPQSGYIAQGMLARQPKAELRYLLDSARGSLVERLHSEGQRAQGRRRPTLAPLSHWVMLRRGEELRKESHLLVDTHPEEGIWYPVLRGGVDVSAYRSPRSVRWIEHSALRKPLERYHVPKLLIIKSTGQLQAALDMERHVVLQTLYMLLPVAKVYQNPQEQEDDLFFLLALLNSRLLRSYVYLLHTAYKWVQPQIEQHVLARLPIPTLKGAERLYIIQRARALQAACSSIPSVVELKEKEMYEEIEQAICALYETALQGRRASYSLLHEINVDKGVTYG